MAGWDDEEWQRIRTVRRFRELFRGRFTDVESKKLVEHHNYDIYQTAQFALRATQAELHAILGEHDWQKATYLRRNHVLRDLALRNQVEATFRQFSCQACDNMWWRKVPERKMVSRCKQCKNKFNALPRDQEWGWAKFSCQCGNEFHALGAMDVSMLGHGLHGKSRSICYQCKQRLCEPAEIIPPLTRNERRGRSRNTHQCTAHNCFRKCPPTPGVPVIPICVHPRSLGNVIVAPSDNHVSTGSTVKTFLTQDELAPPHAPYEPSLADIDEDDGDNM